MIYAEYAIKHLVPMLVECIECKKAKRKDQVVFHGLNVMRKADDLQLFAMDGTHEWARELSQAAFKKDTISEIKRLADITERCLREDLNSACNLFSDYKNRIIDEAKQAGIKGK